MDINQIISGAKIKLDAIANHFNEELKRIRTGRAHPGMLEGVMVETYGVSIPLKQAASITAPEAQLLQITPFDPGNISMISEAIRNNQSLGLNPMDDGRVVRIPVPPLTTERRQQIVKQLHEKIEESLISARSVRHEAFDEIKKAKSNKLIGEDDSKRAEKQIDDMIQKQKNAIDAIALEKEKEIMTV